MNNLQKMKQAILANQILGENRPESVVSLAVPPPGQRSKRPKNDKPPKKNPTPAPVAPPAVPTPARTIPTVRDRLPDGSRFDVAYSAKPKVWQGTLTVPGCPGPFTRWASGVFTLLRDLDTDYREWKKLVDDSGSVG